MKKKKLLALAAIALVGLSGCAKPTKLDVDALSQSYKEDLSRLYDHQIDKPLRLEDVAAYTLLRNADIKLKVVELEAATGKKLLTNLGMLPEVTAQLESRYRSNYAASTSARLSGDDLGNVDSDPAYSSEKDTRIASLGASIDLLNMVSTYISAKQAANDAEIAAMNHERSAQKSVREAVAAYFLKASDASVGDDLAASMKELSENLDVVCANIPANSTSTDTLYNRCSDGLNRLRITESILQNLKDGNTNLAAILSIDPSVDIPVVPPDMRDPGRIKLNKEDLIQIAVQNRPELFIEEYRKANASLEKTNALFEILPSFEVGVETSYNSNKFLVNNDWGESYVALNWNILKALIEAPTKMQLAAIKERLADGRKDSLLITISTQISLAVDRYNASWEKWQVSYKLASLKKNAAKRFEMASKVGQVEKIKSTVAQIEYYGAKYQEVADYASMMDSAYQLYLALGIHTLPMMEATDDVEVIAANFKQTFKELGVF